MKAYTFTIDRPKDLEKTLAEVKRNIEENKGSFIGDEKTGSISVSGVKGSYCVTAHDVEITIIDKPFIVSTSYVEKEVRDAFRGVY